MIHFPIPQPIKAYLAPGLIDSQERKVTLQGVCVYPGTAMSFYGLTEEGALYVDIPPHMLNLNPNVVAGDLARHVFRNNPNGQAIVQTMAGLGRARIFHRDRSFLTMGHYVTTIDWADDNWMMHLVVTDAGQMMFWPHHKILWNHETGNLPEGFRKVRQTWSVG